MESDSTRDLLVRGVAAAKVKDYAEARHYLEWLLNLDPPREQQVEALIWLAECSDDPAQKRSYIEDALARDPAEPRARRALAILEGELDPAKIVDPDHLAPPARRGAELADARRFTCPTCGGRMVFAADGQSLVCEYCAGKERLAAAAASGPRQRPASAGLSRPPDGDEQNFLVAMATAKGHLAPVATKTFSCQGCGARFVLPPQQISLTCPYCDSTYVMENKETAELAAPAQLIPFQLEEAGARQAIRDWLRALKLESAVRVTGGLALYLPAWTFDLGGQIDFHYEVKVREQRWGGGPVGRDPWEARRGEQILYYNDLLIPATRRLPAVCTAEMGLYDKTGFVEYDPRFLSNWPAETYQVELGDAALEARSQAFKAEQERARRKLVGQPVRNLAFSSMGLIVESYKLVLVPAWLAHYQSEGQRYDLVVNGQTGHVTGARPLKGVSGFLRKLIGEDKE